MTTNLTLTSGRWTTREAITSPKPCASCNFSGAALRPHQDTGQPVCSVCDSSTWPLLTEDTPEAVVDAYFAAREALPAHIIPTDMASWVYRLSNYLRKTRTPSAVTHESPTADLLAAVLAVEVGEACSPELVMRAAALAGFSVLQTATCTHIGMSAEPSVWLPNTVRVEVGPAPAGWERGAA